MVSVGSSRPYYIKRHKRSESVHRQTIEGIGTMKILGSLFFLINLAGSAWAGPSIVTADGPEMAAGVLGMSLAAGVVYLIKRRKRN